MIVPSTVAVRLPDKPAMGIPLVTMRGIVKIFGGITALGGVDLDIYPGEVHAILGENGAGKSTLMKILSGIHAPSAGTITIDDKPYAALTPGQAAHAGISIIYQELSVINELSALENLFVGRIPVLRRFGVPTVDWRRMRREAATVLTRLGLDIDLETPVGELPIAHRQMIEIAKSLMRDARILVMDEPTSSLTNVEVERLFALVRQLRADGTAILFISHKLDEVRTIGDRFSVLKDGVTSGTGMVADTTNDDLVRKMVGRDVKRTFLNEGAVDRGAQPVLRVRDVTSVDRKRVVDVGFDVYSGEILGFAGLVGSGRTELMNCLFGTMARASGRIELNGRDVTPKGPIEALKSGMAYITEARRQTGFMPNFSIKDNIVISQCLKAAPLRGIWGLIHPGPETESARQQHKNLSIKCASIHQNITELSGGNQQKVLIGKWLATNPDLFIFDEPTRGIDVGAKSEIYAIMRNLSKAGKAIIMVSSELPEILAVCDRIAIFRAGQIVKIIDSHSATEEQILHFALNGR
ncbi:MAG: ATP-binding cassette domain-containing protein [Azospirillaceae bacterium]|nr:ATP-binding cassette domain-containing protein [Azospirillaceae bacterium]